MSWFKRIFKKNPEIVPKDDVRQVSEPAFTPLPRPASEQEAQTYLQRTREKIQELAHRFADGGLNRKQFEDLYTYYQNEIQRLEFFINENPLAEDWKNVISEGQSVMIRRKSAARLVGYSIYENHSGMPLRTAGDFGVDPALFVPMLYAYRSATQEIFGGQVHSTQIEGGKWLCFTPGKFTTTLALFSREPAGKQLTTMEELQKLFESANKAVLERLPVDTSILVCPQEFFLTHPL
jgi:hypothetical protein